MFRCRAAFMPRSSRGVHRRRSGIPRPISARSPQVKTRIGPGNARGKSDTGRSPAIVEPGSHKAVQPTEVVSYLGLAIGIECRDYPIFTKPVKATSPFLPGSYDVPIEENMVISIEVPYTELGLGGFQVEYTLLVKKDGCEKLYPHTRELVVR